jgi:hypothetical protein
VSIQVLPVLTASGSGRRACRRRERVREILAEVMN